MCMMQAHEHLAHVPILVPAWLSGPGHRLAGPCKTKILNGLIDQRDAARVQISHARPQDDSLQACQESDKNISTSRKMTGRQISRCCGYVQAGRASRSCRLMNMAECRSACAVRCSPASDRLLRTCVVLCCSFRAAIELQLQPPCWHAGFKYMGAAEPPTGLVVDEQTNASKPW